MKNTGDKRRPAASAEVAANPGSMRGRLAVRSRREQYRRCRIGGPADKGKAGKRIPQHELSSIDRAECERWLLSPSF